MKFKFCGDADCQDWILAQINVMSKFTVIKLKLVIAEVINHLLTSKLNHDKVSSICNDARLSEEESKGVVAALNFILSNSVKHDANSEVVCNELQQLGLPKEHSVALCKSLSTNAPKLREAFCEQSCKFHTFNGLEYKIEKKITDGRLTLHEPSLILKLDVQDQPSESFHVDPDRLDALIKDLKDALHTMENINV